MPARSRHAEPTCRPTLSTRLRAQAARRRASPPTGSRRLAARRRIDALRRRCGFPTTARRGVALHQRRADRRGTLRPPGGRRRRRCRGERLEPLPARPTAPALVFVNGRFAAELSSRPDELPDGVVAGSLAAGARPSIRTSSSRHLGRHADLEQHAFAALNTALLDDGAVHPRAAAASWSSSRSTCVFLAHRRGRRRDGLPPAHPGRRRARRARLTVIESYVGLPATSRTSPTPVTELVGEASSVVDHYRLQQESARRLPRRDPADPPRSATANFSHPLDHPRRRPGAQRHQRRARRRGRRAAPSTASTWPRGTQHVDNHTRVDHAKPHCNSRELYKGILDGRAAGVFNGRIIVRPDAQKTDAKQSNRNLLLSDDALGQHQAAARDLRRRRASAPTARPSASSTRRRSSTCAPAASAEATAREPADPRLRRRGARADRASSRCASDLEELLFDRACRRASRRQAMSARRCDAPASPTPSAVAPPSTSSASARDFPILAQQVHGKPLVYLDNAATTQKPQAVIDADRALLRARQRQHPPRRPHAVASAPPTPTRRRAATVAALPRRGASRARSSSPAAPPRRSTWWPRASRGRSSAPATRS